MSKTKEEIGPITAEEKAGIFMSEARKLSPRGLMVLVSDLTKNNTFDFPTPAEVRGEFHRSRVVLLGNESETIKKAKDKIDDLAVSLEGQCGFLLDTGEIETNPRYNPLNENSQFNKQFVSNTVYTFGINQSEANDNEAEELDFNF